MTTLPVKDKSNSLFKITRVDQVEKEKRKVLNASLV